MRGGSTCWNGARSRRTRRRSTSTGSGCRTGAAAACCCRCSGKPYGEALTERRDRAEIRRRRGQLLGLVFRAPAADQSAALQRDASRRSSAPRTPATSRPDARCWRSPAEYARPGTPSYAAGAGAQARARRHRGRRADHRARACGLSRRPRGRQSTRCIGCWSGSIIGSPIGGSRCPASTTGASSTSTSWPACASRTRGRSATSMRWSRG